MMIVRQGPTLNELIRKMGGKDPVQFTLGGKLSADVKVRALCAAGCDDLSIDLPDRTWTDAKNVWYITGSMEEYEEGFSPTVVVLAVFNSRGRMTVGVLVRAMTEEKSAAADTSLMLKKIFSELAVDSFRPSS